MEYLDSLQRGAQIVWKNKGLWFLGVLSGCAALDQANGPDLNFSGRGNADLELLERLSAWLQAWMELSPTRAINTGIIVCAIMLALGLACLLIGLIGRGSLLKGAQLAQANGQVSFGAAYAAGREQLGRLFSLWVFTDLPFAIIGLAMTAGGLYFLYTMFARGYDLETMIRVMPSEVLCLLPLLCIVALARIFARILNHMGTLTAVFEEQRGLTALQSGLAALRANFLPYTLIAVILGVAQAILGWVLFLPLILASILTLSATFLGTGANRTLVSFGVLLVCGGGYLPVLILGHGALHAWAYATWADLYQRLRGAGSGAVAPTPAPEAAAEAVAEGSALAAEADAGQGE